MFDLKRYVEDAKSVSTYNESTEPLKDRRKRIWSFVSFVNIFISIFTLILNLLVVLFLMNNFERFFFEEDVRVISFLENPETVCSLDSPPSSACLVWQYEFPECYFYTFASERQGSFQDPFKCDGNPLFYKNAIIFDNRNSGKARCQNSKVFPEFSIIDDCDDNLPEKLVIDPPLESRYDYPDVQPICLLIKDCPEISTIKANILDDSGFFDPIETAFYPPYLVIMITFLILIDCVELVMSMRPAIFLALASSDRVFLIATCISLVLNFLESIFLVIIPAVYYFDIIDESGTDSDTLVVLFLVFNSLSIIKLMWTDFKIFRDYQYRNYSLYSVSAASEDIHEGRQNKELSVESLYPVGHTLCKYNLFGLSLSSPSIQRRRLDYESAGVPEPLYFETLSKVIKAWKILYESKKDNLIFCALFAVSFIGYLVYLVATQLTAFEFENRSVVPAFFIIFIIGAFLICPGVALLQAGDNFARSDIAAKIIETSLLNQEIGATKWTIETIETEGQIEEAVHYLYIRVAKSSVNNDSTAVDMANSSPVIELSSSVQVTSKIDQDSMTVTASQDPTADASTMVVISNDSGPAIVAQAAYPAGSQDNRNLNRFKIAAVVIAFIVLIIVIVIVIVLNIDNIEKAFDFGKPDPNANANANPTDNANPTGSNCDGAPGTFSYKCVDTTQMIKCINGQSTVESCSFCNCAPGVWKTYDICFFQGGPFDEC